MLSWDNSSDSTLFVHRIKEEIERLTREHDEAVRSATFLGMTRQEQEHFHSRRRRITELIEQLAIFEEAE